MPNQLTSALNRDEQYQQLLELKDKMKLLDSIIQEGNLALDFQDSPFYPIFARTMLALKESYNSDAHKAAKDSRAEISNFLGREEAIKEMFSILSEFAVKSEQAKDEKQLTLDQIQELQAILATPETISVDNGGAMG